jgi:hypothetical protein
MTRLALAVAIILTLASSGGIAQEAQPPGTAPPAAQQPAAPPPAAQQPEAPPPAAQQPEAPPPTAQQPEGPPPGAQQGGARRRGPPQWYFACRPQVAQFCGKVKPGGGRIRLCLMHGYYKLPQACRQALMQGRGQ